MKIRMSLKLALFAFLSAIVSMVANSFIGLPEIRIIVDALWFLAYVCLVIWTCKYVAKVKRIGKNLVVLFFSFSLAAYFGVYCNLIENSDIALIAGLLFYAAALICLGSAIVLLARWIFGKSEQPVETKYEPVIAEQNNWTCACGVVNSGNFCSNCGNRKPEELVEIVESIPQGNADKD